MCPDTGISMKKNKLDISSKIGLVILLRLCREIYHLVIVTLLFWYSLCCVTKLTAVIYIMLFGDMLWCSLCCESIHPSMTVTMLYNEMWWYMLCDFTSSHYVVLEYVVILSMLCDKTICGDSHYIVWWCVVIFLRSVVILFRLYGDILVSPLFCVHHSLVYTVY